MKYALRRSVLALSLGLVSTALVACGSTRHDASEASGTSEVVPYALEHCLVMTDVPVGPGSVRYEYEGYELKFCCEACVDTFEDDPDGFMAEYESALAARD